LSDNLQFISDQIDDMEPDDASKYIDVKIPLQCLVRDSQIKVHTSFRVI
jgi:Domain of unknown function (DUF3395)